MKETTHHACKMPRRRKRWHHEIYICDCLTGWTVIPKGWGGLEAGGTVWLWHKVELTVSEEATYKHG